MIYHLTFTHFSTPRFSGQTVFLAYWKKLSLWRQCEGREGGIHPLPNKWPQDTFFPLHSSHVSIRDSGHFPCSPCAAPSINCRGLLRTHFGCCSDGCGGGDCRSCPGSLSLAVLESGIDLGLPQRSCLQLGRLWLAAPERIPFKTLEPCLAACTLFALIGANDLCFLASEIDPCWGPRLQKSSEREGCPSFLWT